MNNHDRNDAVPHDTEDKQWWLRHGERKEEEFVKLCTKSLGLAAKINPEKLKDPTVPDLIVNELLADLKVQNTPFFTAARYGVDPGFAVTFNRKDFERYANKYPDIHIYFWVDWNQTKWKDQSVEPLSAIYHVPFSKISELIRSGKVPEHTYKHRIGDSAGNARSSFLFDVRKFERISKADVPL